MPKVRRTSINRKPRLRVAQTKPTVLEDPDFLNIDLDVRSRRSLASLVAAWPWSYQPMLEKGRPDPRWLILNPQSVRKLSAEAAAKELLRHIEKLTGDARRSWRQAHRRTFDIGVQAGGPGRAFDEVRLTVETLGRIAAAGADIQVTVYPAQPLELNEPRRN